MGVQGERNKRYSNQMKQEDVLKNISNRLYENSVPVQIRKGGILIQKGERAEAAYFITSGKLYVQTEFLNGNIYQFSLLEKGTFVSDIEVLTGTYINAATLVAAEDTTVLKFPLRMFENELKRNIEFLYYVSSGIAVKMYFSSCIRGQNLFKKGIHKVVLYLIHNYETDEMESDLVKIKKDRGVIASEIGISIKTLNRSIEQLKKERFITIDRGKITVSGEQFQKLVDWAEREVLY